MQTVVTHANRRYEWSAPAAGNQDTDVTKSFLLLICTHYIQVVSGLLLFSHQLKLSSIMMTSSTLRARLLNLLQMSQQFMRSFVRKKHMHSQISQLLVVYTLENFWSLIREIFIHLHYNKFVITYEYIHVPPHVGM